MLKLKEARVKTGLTQRDVAEKTGIPLGTLRRWEQGVNEPDTDTIIKLADLYGASMDEILGSGFAKDSKQEMSADERELLTCYRSADGRGRRNILMIARAEAGMEGNLPDTVRKGA